MEEKNKHKIPITIITGYLGSGKTTLLKHLLEENKNKNKKLAIIEHTELGIQNELQDSLQHATCVGELFESGGGCLCCSDSSEFQNIMQQLIQLRNKIDNIVIETTGLASPSFIQVFFNDKNIFEYIKIIGIITMVDAKNVLQQIEINVNNNKMDDIDNNNNNNKESIIIKKTELEEQLMFADKIIINKIDLVKDLNSLEKIKDYIKTLNPFADIITTSFANVQFDTIFNTQFDLDRILSISPHLLSENDNINDNKNSNYTIHDTQILTLSLRSLGEFKSLDTFNEWIKSLITENDFIRTKGCIHINSELYVYQGVKSNYNISINKIINDSTNHTISNELNKFNRFIFIGKNIIPINIINNYNLFFKNKNESVPLMKMETFRKMNNNKDSNKKKKSTPPPWYSLIILLGIMIIYKFQGNLWGESYGWPTAIALLLCFLLFFKNRFFK